MALMDWFTSQNQGEISYTWWQVFLVAFFGSIVLEYVTSWGLEKLFHAYWWDYSDVPLNINGRVCFPASVGFGVAGLLVIYVIAPVTRDATIWITPILMELFSLIFMALLAADATLTVSALTGFERNVAAMEEALNQHMEQFVSTVQQRSQAAGRNAGREKTGSRRGSGGKETGSQRSSGRGKTSFYQRKPGTCDKAHGQRSSCSFEPCQGI